jgi:hypothetical protein
MPVYAVEYLCHECGQVHRAVEELWILDGEPAGGSLDELYRGRDLPPELAELKTRPVWCDETAEWLEMEDPAQIFLVPSGLDAADRAGLEPTP